VIHRDFVLPMLSNILMILHNYLHLLSQNMKKTSVLVVATLSWLFTMYPIDNNTYHGVRRVPHINRSIIAMFIRYHMQNHHVSWQKVTLILKSWCCWPKATFQKSGWIVLLVQYFRTILWKQNCIWSRFATGIKIFWQEVTFYTLQVTFFYSLAALLTTPLK
jgi:hypothetical protein